MKDVLVIVGPTAVGKTDLSLELAQRFHGEIISGDSMQVYRNLDIGTNKIPKNQRRGITHHLIDICDVSDQYTAARFVKDATEKINEVTSRGNLPIIAGGTGFYLTALLNGMKLGTVEDQELRTKLNQELNSRGPEALWNRLNLVDPVAAKQIPLNNSRRIIRALEVCLLAGEKFSDQSDAGKQFNSLIVGLNCDRTVLYNRINERVLKMMDKGLLSENEWLVKQGGFGLPAAKGIGYREFKNYFENNEPLGNVVSDIKKDSRHYAKRQLTWFNNKMDVDWYNLVEHPDDLEKITEKVKKWRTKDGFQ